MELLVRELLQEVYQRKEEKIWIISLGRSSQENEREDENYSHECFK